MGYLFVLPAGDWKQGCVTPSPDTSLLGGLWHITVIFPSVRWVPHTACFSGVAELPEDAEKAGYQLTAANRPLSVATMVLCPLLGFSCVPLFLMGIL